MGQRMTAVAWLEQDYDAVFALGQAIVDSATALMGLKVTSYAPDAAQEGPGPLFSIKRDDFAAEPRWPDAAWWPEPHSMDDLDTREDW